MQKNLQTQGIMQNLQQIQQKWQTKKGKNLSGKKNFERNMMVVPMADTKNQIIRMFYMEKILMMRRSRSRRSSEKWERLRYAVRS